jgi:hypothetical protein
MHFRDAKDRALGDNHQPARRADGYQITNVYAEPENQAVTCACR